MKTYHTRRLNSPATIRIGFEKVIDSYYTQDLPVEIIGLMIQSQPFLKVLIDNKISYKEVITLSYNKTRIIEYIKLKKLHNLIKLELLKVFRVNEFYSQTFIKEELRRVHLQFGFDKKWRAGYLTNFFTITERVRWVNKKNTKGYVIESLDSI